jgi:hypothetical protein
VKLVEAVDGRKDGIDGRLAPPGDRFPEEDDVSVGSPEPGHEAGKLTQADLRPGKLGPGEVVPEQLEMVSVRTYRVRRTLDIVEIRQEAVNRVHGQVVIADN